MKFQLTTIYKDGMKSVQHFYTLEKAIAVKHYNIDRDIERAVIVPTCILKKIGFNDFEWFIK